MKANSWHITVSIKTPSLFRNDDSDQSQVTAVTANVKAACEPRIIVGAQQQLVFWCAFFFRSTMFVWMR